MKGEILPLTEMSDQELRKIKLVVFDVDGVIIRKGSTVHENADGTEFTMRTNRLSQRFVDSVMELKKHVRVSFSSGRNILYLKTIVRDFFDESIILQAENGNMAFINGNIIHPIYPSGYFESIYRIRNHISENAEALKLEGFEPKIFILSVHMLEQNDMIYKILNECDPKGIIDVVWGGEAYDFGPKGVTKGSMLNEVSRMLKLARDEIMTMGNALNDAEMLEFGIGVTVEPGVVWGKYKTSGKGLGGEEIAEFLVGKFAALGR